MCSERMNEQMTRMNKNIFFWRRFERRHSRHVWMNCGRLEWWNQRGFFFYLFAIFVFSSSSSWRLRRHFVKVDGSDVSLLWMRLLVASSNVTEFLADYITSKRPNLGEFHRKFHSTLEPQLISTFPHEQSHGEIPNAILPSGPLYLRNSVKNIFKFVAARKCWHKSDCRWIDKMRFLSANW